jgi:hypothetical protein
MGTSKVTKSTNVANTENTISTEAIQELVELTLRSRRDSHRAKQLRTQAKMEALALYKARHWEVGKDMPFEGATLRLYYETVFTWAKNTKIKGALMDLYLAQLEHIDLLKQQLKEAEENLKNTEADLAKENPNSESIKRELRFQIR